MSKRNSRRLDRLAPQDLELVKYNILCRCNIHIGLRPISDVPSVDVRGFLIDTKWEQRVGAGGIGSASIDSLLGRGHHCSGIRVNAEKIGCIFDIRQLRVIESPSPGESMQHRIRVLFSKEDGISEESKLHFLETIGGLNMAGILWILGHAEVVIELQTHFTSPFKFIVVKMKDLGVSVNDIVNTLEVERIEEWLVKGYPDWDSIRKMGEKDLAIIHEPAVISNAGNVSKFLTYASTNVSF